MQSWTFWTKTCDTSWHYQDQYHYPSKTLCPFSISTASLWLRVHKQTPQNVHRHERERRPQQQVQQFHQDTGDGGGPGHQLPDLCITGEEDIPRTPTTIGFKSKNIMSIIRLRCLYQTGSILPTIVLCSHVFGTNVYCCAKCHVVAGWSLASHTCSLLHIRHPSRTREECADGEFTLVEHSANISYRFTLMKGVHCKNRFCLPLLLQFELFYNQHFSGRKLTWLHYLCTGNTNTHVHCFKYARFYCRNASVWANIWKCDCSWRLGMPPWGHFPTS